MIANRMFGSTVKKILNWQVLAILIISSGFFFVGGWHKAFAAILGGFTGFLPNVYLALKVSKVNQKEPKQILQTFYAGEFGKLLLTVVMFVLLFQVEGIELIPLMTCYVGVLSVFWFALIIRE